MEPILYLDAVRISKDLYKFITMIHSIKIGLTLIMYNFAEGEKNYLLYYVFIMALTNSKYFLQWRFDGVSFLNGCSIYGFILNLINFIWIGNGVILDPFNYNTGVFIFFLILVECIDWIIHFGTPVVLFRLFILCRPFSECFSKDISDLFIRKRPLIENDG